MSQSAMPAATGAAFSEARVMAITRPKDSLWTYYIIVSLGSLFVMPFVLIYLYFRFHTLRYRFDDEGISMSWGILFHQEILLNYSRIQDIHLRSNAIERWLGLARIEIQTASGGAGSEMTIEGLDNAEEVRDFLYSRMRGARHEHEHQAPLVGAAAAEQASELTAALASAAQELRAIRQLLAAESQKAE